MSESPSINQHVFISYARADGDTESKQIYDALYQERFLAWRDQRNIKPYQDFSVAIERAIRRSSHVLVCLTPSIVQRDDSFVRREIIYAQNQKRPIIPLLFDGFPTKDIPILISHLTYINFAKFAEGFRNLLEHLQRKDVDYEPPDLPDDPFRQHVEQLNDYMIGELEQMVSNSKIIALRSENQPNAVEKPLPVAYRIKRPHFFPSGEQPHQEFDNFGEAFVQYQQRMLLLGEPGSGKTTTLCAFAREKANERLADVRTLLPIYVPIRTWDGKMALMEWIANASGISLNQVELEISLGHALLLLDGLDELAPDITSLAGENDLRKKFLQRLSELGSTPILITCRLKDYDELVVTGGERAHLNGAAMLKPLSSEQVRDYLEDYPQLLRAIQSDEDLFEMARTPLLLTLLTVTFPEEIAKKELLANINSSRAEWRDLIFSAYVQRRYEFEGYRSGKLPFSLNKIYEVLGQAATNLVADKKRPTFNELDLQLFKDLQLLQAQQFIDFVQRLHYLASSDKRVFRFLHLLLRDHFATRYLQPKARSDNLVVRQTAQKILSLLNASTINVFISYQHKDKENASSIREMLQRNGISVWRDDQNISGGQKWSDEIRRAVERSDYIIVMISSDTLKSKYSQNEINLALRLKKTILLIALNDIKIPSDWQGMTVIRLKSFDSNERQLLEKQLLNAILGDDSSSEGKQVYLRTLLRRFERFFSSSVEAYVQMKRRNTETNIVSLFNLQMLSDEYTSPWRIAIVGDPGSGKTTLVQRLSVELARRALHDPFGLIPLVVNAREFTSGPQGMDDFDRVIDVVASRQELEDYSLEQLVVFIDGLDELQPDQLQSLTKWIENHGNIAVLVTSRDYSTQLSLHEFDFAEMVSLRQEQIHDIIFQTFGQPAANDLWQQINTNTILLELIKTPLMLNIVLAMFERNNVLPSSPDALIEQYIVTSVNRVERIISQEQLLRCLRLLARAMHHSQKTILKREEFAPLLEPIFSAERLDIETLVSTLIQSSIIREVSGGISFSHKSFLDYLVREQKP